MALPIPGDRAAETSTTTGTGTYALIGQITGWQTLVAACGSGVEVDYFVRNPDIDADYEVGRGTTGAGTLTRDTIYASSNAGAAVNWAAGTKEVVVTLTANAMAQIDTALSTSAGLAAYVSDETGTGSLVFGTQPTLTHPVMASEAEPTPASGMMYVDSTTNKLRCYEKGNWSDVLSFTEQGTGLVTGGVLSIGTPTSTFSISDGYGFAVDHTTVPGTPTSTPVSWTGKTNITVTNLATALITFVGIDATGTVIQQTSKFSNAQRRDIIVLGVIVHVDNISVNTVNNEQHAAINVVAQVHDLAEAIGFINIFGNIFSQGGTGGLYIQKSAGDVFGIGSNWANSAKNPNVLTLAAEDDIGFQYRTLTGSNRNDNPTAELVIDPNIWDNAGTLTTVPTNKWTAQRVYVFLSGAVKIQAGQEVCATASACIDAIATGNFITEPSIVANGLLRGFIIVQEGETNLANATFIEAEKFGSSTGSGAATGSEFADGIFRVYDDADSSKQIALQASGITTGTTRTITMPDNDVNLGIDFEPADATIVKDADIGVTVQGFDADTAKYDAVTANFTGTLQNGASNVLVDADIGVNVAAYDATLETGATADQTKADIDALEIDAGTLDDLDSTQFLRSDTADTMTGALTFDTGVSSVQTKSANSTTTDEMATSLWTASGKFWQFRPYPAGAGDSTRDFGYDFNTSYWKFDESPYVGTNAVLDDGDLGVTVQGYDVDTAKLDVVQSFTAQQTFKEYAETQYSLTGTVIDPANGSLQYKTLSANTTFTESLVDGQSVTLMINDGTAYTATWPTTTWVGGSAPALPTTGYAVIELWQINSVLYGLHSGDA